VSKAKSPKDILSRMKAVTTRERKPAGESAASAPAPRGLEPAPAAPKKKVRITVDLDPEMHRFLKVYAAERGMKVSEVVRGLISGLSSKKEGGKRG